MAANNKLQTQSEVEHLIKTFGSYTGVPLGMRNVLKTSAYTQTELCRTHVIPIRKRQKSASFTQNRAYSFSLYSCIFACRPPADSIFFPTPPAKSGAGRNLPETAPHILYK